MPHRRLLGLILVSLLLGGLAAAPARAQLSFTLLDTAPPAVPGGSALFQGTIINDTGADLTETDLFFSFDGYDPTSLAVDQVLGDVPVTIADGTTSPTLDLFSVEVLPDVLQGQTLPLTATLEDDSGDVSAPQPAAVTVMDALPGAAVPEAPTLGLVLAGMALVAGRKRRTGPPSR